MSSSLLLSSPCSICVIELLHRRERSHCLPREEEAKRGRQLHFWPNLMSDNENPYSLLMIRGQNLMLCFDLLGYELQQPYSGFERGMGNAA